MQGTWGLNDLNLNTSPAASQIVSPVIANEINLILTISNTRGKAKSTRKTTSTPIIVEDVAEAEDLNLVLTRSNTRGNTKSKRKTVSTPIVVEDVLEASEEVHNDKEQYSNSKNWSFDDFVNLACAWSQVSQNHTTTNNQKAATFWFKVVADFWNLHSSFQIQEAVYAKTSPVVTSVLDEFNVCIFACGKTGMGKTFTMRGTHENRRVNYKTLEQVFRMTNERTTTPRYELFVSMSEVYNEKIRDLLVESSDHLKKNFILIEYALCTNVDCRVTLFMILKRRNIIFKKSFGAPKVTKDGVAVANSTELNLRNELRIWVPHEPHSFPVLYLTRDVKSIPAAMNAMDLKCGITLAVNSLVTCLKNSARMICISDEIA
ncbi:hypothetical protein GIB67_019109 [Kingdonia uniflora]|uniref:Kinesin motor domain-containing protein n=1 Tax=Kingdonia uniflora TaxID=39325 RepID=A0A7J7MZZ1_9MAGN|nr:hypothetical protein GIB67_019109 [Kingdonia uniflora]